MKTIHDEMRERVKLAFLYAEDGAPGSAAAIFQGIANEYQNRADAIAELMGADLSDSVRAKLRRAVRDHFESVLERGEETGDFTPYESRTELVGTMRAVYAQTGLDFSHPLLEG